MEAIKYEVFLSRKSEDAHLAKKIYDFLTEKGLKVFDSDHSLQEMGNADYSKAIDTALINSEHLIVIGSSAENISSSWVEAEWRFFLNRKRSGKINGNLLTVIGNGFNIDNLPPSLQNYEVIKFSHYNFSKILSYVLNNKRSGFKKIQSMESPKKTEGTSFGSFTNSQNSTQKTMQKRLSGSFKSYINSQNPTPQINERRNSANIFGKVVNFLHPDVLGFLILFAIVFIHYLLRLHFTNVNFLNWNIWSVSLLFSFATSLLFSFSIALLIKIDNFFDLDGVFWCVSFSIFFIVDFLYPFYNIYIKYWYFVV